MQKKISNTVYKVITVIMIIFVLFLLGVRLCGLKPYAVTSGSMTPSYKVGSMIFVKNTIPENVKKGEVITFLLGDSAVAATHRVVEVDVQNRCFYTKGDANEFADSQPVPFENLVGVSIFNIPMLGYISSFVSQPPGMYIVIISAALIVLASVLLDAVINVNKDVRAIEKHCMQRYR